MISATFLIIPRSRLNRGDAVERSRKEVEHRVLSYEEAIEGRESKLREAAHLTEEATRKREEAAYKRERVAKAMERATERADRAEKQVIKDEGFVVVVVVVFDDDDDAPAVAFVVIEDVIAAAAVVVVVVAVVVVAAAASGCDCATAAIWRRFKPFLSHVKPTPKFLFVWRIPPI